MGAGRASWWDRHVVPRVVDRACGDPLLGPARERAARGLRGRVLELGFGSGTSCPLYPAGVEEVLAVEPSDLAWELSRERRDACGVPVRRVGLDAGRLEVDDAAVDSVLVAFTLCTVPDPAAALAQVHRVLRPGGTLHVAEHGLAPDASVARWQRRLDGTQQRLFGGCHLTRDPAAELARAGFAEPDLDHRYLPVPRPGRAWAYVTSGSVRRAGSTHYGGVNDEEDS